MLGFELVRADGTTIKLEATHYVVTEDGAVEVLADDDLVLRADPASWIEIREIGTKLTSIWPPEDLGLLLDNLSWKLGVGRRAACGGSGAGGLRPRAGRPVLHRAGSVGTDGSTPARGKI